MVYIIKELNYIIVSLYWLFLQTIQKQSYVASDSWKLIKEFYDKCYSKYELTASATLAESYYKINTQLMKAMHHWQHPIRININRFLAELKNEEELPGRYKFD